MNSRSHPIVTVDIVILTLKNGSLHAALAKRDKEPYAECWALPGGWVHPDEDQDDQAAATRILQSKVGLKSPYLEQLCTFASRSRDARGWSVSIAQYALVPLDTVGQVNNAQLKWVAVDEIRSLPFDHMKILQVAVDRVRSKTLYSSLPVHLMPATFTLSDLQKVYESLLQSSLDKRTFRRRIEELDVVEPVAGLMSEGGAHRPAQLFRVRPAMSKKLSTAESNLGVKA